MNKNFYAVKLLPSRPDFAQTMTDEEKEIMGEHAAYWTTHMSKGMVHVFGPVFDPNGVYGLGIVSAEDEDQLKTFIDNDPALKINKVEYYPMMAMVAEK